MRTEGEQYALNRMSSVNDIHLDYFRFFGRFIGKSVYDKRVVDVPFSGSIYEHILGKDLTLASLREVDLVKYKSLRWMATNAIEGVIFETFSVTIDTFGEKKEVELIEGMGDVDVTDENKHAYIDAVVQYELAKSVDEQLKSFLEGFYELVPLAVLGEMDVDELRLLLNGSSSIDVERLCVHTKYTGGFEEKGERSPTVRMFWDVMRKLDHKERGVVLRFATGSSKEPLEGFKPSFTLTLVSGEDDDGTPTSSDKLPSSHTCFNQLVLPKCASAETLQDKLLYAVRHGGGFYLS